MARIIFVYCTLALLASLAKADFNVSESNCCDNLWTEILNQSAIPGEVIEHVSMYVVQQEICSINVTGIDGNNCNAEVLEGGLGQTSVVLKVFTDVGTPLLCQVELIGQCLVPA